jgi:hypothetical protein
MLESSVSFIVNAKNNSDGYKIQRLSVKVQPTTNPLNFKFELPFLNLHVVVHFNTLLKVRFLGRHFFRCLVRF